MRKLRYTEISQQRLNQFVATAGIGRLMIAEDNIMKDLNKTILGLRLIEEEIKTEKDSWQLKRHEVEQRLAINRWEAQRRCYLAVKDEMNRRTQEYIKRNTQA